MNTIQHDDPIAVKVCEVIRQGQLDSLQDLLARHPELGKSFIDDRESKCSLLHVATDWPGHFPNVAETITLLIEAGADANARMVSDAHNETPLLHAASSNDVAAIEALVAGGADLELDGSVSDGGTALSAAVNFENYDAARRLVELGAKTVLYTAASLGMLERVKQLVADNDKSLGSMNNAFWMACSTGETEVVKFLAQHGANRNWIPEWDKTSPLDIAAKNGRDETANWLRDNGAMPANEIEPS